MRSTVNALPLALVVLLVLAGLRGCRGENHARGGATPPEAGQFGGALYGACRVRPSAKLPPGQPRVYGHVLFRQDGPEAAVQVRFDLCGLPRTDGHQRAIHVHQYGDLSDGCDATGGHYNPHGNAHPGHPGDFGNFVPRGGRIREQREVGGATLFGGLTVLGRAVVIHQGRDDLGRGGDAGSRLHGNAGPRLACCVIGLSSAQLWDTPPHRARTPSG